MGKTKRHARFSMIIDATRPGETILMPEGDWLKQMQIPRIGDLALPHDTKALVLDGARIRNWDTMLLAFITRLEQYAESNAISFELINIPPGAKRLLDLTKSTSNKLEPPERKPDSFLATLGNKTLQAAKSFASVNRFVGELVMTLLKFQVGLARTRWSDIWRQIALAGHMALPLISMIGFLIGLILAFIGSIPLKMFGAEIFVASLVGIGILRLMGPVMVGVVMAGRTGAAYAAELGSMNANDEIEASRAMGLSPMETLVLPRFLALCFVLPPLCIYADLLGLAGGMAVGIFYSGLNRTEFLRQLSSTTTLNDLFVGVFSGFVFGVLIAICGCYQGIRCKKNSTAVGQAATSAVVASLICMVIATTIITILCVILKI